MQFQFSGLDKTAERLSLFPACDGKINLPYNCENDPFELPQERSIRPHYLLRFKNISIAPEGAIFKGLQLSNESIFHDGLKNSYSKKSSKFKFFKRNYLKHKTITVQKAMIAADPWSLINYYHWFCDAMPRLAAAISHFEKDFFLIVPYEKHSISNELLFDSIAAFGIPKNRIIKLEKNQKVKAEELLMPAHISQYGTIFFRPELIDSLREKMLQFYSDRLTKNLGSKIYISRSKAHYRKISNENEMVELLKKYDFNVVNMEDYSLIEQISIAHHARYLLSCHGAGLTNIMFMKKNSFVLELINENLNRPHFYLLSSGASLNYLCRKCKQSSSENFEENADIIVDLSELEKDLKTMISN